MRRTPPRATRGITFLAVALLAHAAGALLGVLRPRRHWREIPLPSRNR